MPPPKKLDLIPQELKARLEHALAAQGFGSIVPITDELNSWLEDAGLELTIGKSAVGEYAKLLKDQQAAFSMTSTLLADLDIEAESDLHRTLLNMIMTSAMQMICTLREKDEHLESKDLVNLGRMLKDLMGSTGIREKLMADERARIAREATAKAAEDGAQAAREAGLSDDAAELIKGKILGVEA